MKIVSIGCRNSLAVFIANSKVGVFVVPNRYNHLSAHAQSVLQFFLTYIRRFAQLLYNAS